MFTEINAPHQEKLLPEKGNRPPLRLEFLDGLRGLAAFYVVLFHFLWVDHLPHWANLAILWTRLGHCAVTVFIVLSGYSLMVPVVRSADHTLKGGALGYLKRRAWRIMPPYYAAIALSLLGLALSPEGKAFLHGVRSKEWLTNFDPMVLISHLLLFDNLKLEWSTRINLPLWSVATEWQIYFLLPLALLPLWRRFGNMPMLAAGLLLGMIPMSAALWHQNLSAACLWYVGVFSLGAVGASLSFGVNTPQMRRATSDKSLLCITLAALAAYVLVARCVPPVHVAASASDFGTRFYVVEALKDISVGVGIVCLLVFCARERHETALPLVLRLLQSRLAKTLGVFSYSLYLTHCIVLDKVGYYVQVLHLSPLASLAFRVFVAVPVALGFAYAFHLAFERPFLVKRTQEKNREKQSALVSPSIAR